MKRKWTNVGALGWQIEELRGKGKTRREIGDELGLTKTQVKNWINQHNRNEARLEAGMLPKKRGRPRKETAGMEKEKDHTIKRLRMENELLRDFLGVAGRR